MKALILKLAAVCSLLYSPVFSQITFDASTTASGNGVSLTFSHTCSGSNRILVIGVTSKGGAVSSVTYAGTNLTFLGGITRAGEVRAEMWYIIAPATGANNVIVTMNSSRNIAVGANSYTCVRQVSPFSVSGTNSGASATPSITLASAPGELVIDALSVKESNPTPAAGQTQRTERTQADNYWHSTSEKTGAASVTISYSTLNKDWAIVGGSLVPDCSALPIELLSFDAYAENNSTVICSWETASETNNAYFVVQRSQDALNFQDIGYVDGAGTSVSTLSYHFSDNDPYSGISYYRLKQVDFDGTSSFSYIVAVNIQDIDIVNFYPNPATENVTVMIVSPEDKDVRFSIIASNGQLMLQESWVLKKGLTPVKFDITSLCPGVYVFDVSDGHASYSQKQFLVK